MAIRTQGTQLYFIDPEDDSVVTIGCVTTITGLTAARDQIETTCLDSAARTYEAGMATPGAASFGINFDTSDASHIRLHELYRTGTIIEFALGWSDFTPPPPAAGPAPTVDSNGGFSLPTGRSWITFDGYISDLPFDFALNTVVTSTVSIQVSDFPVLVPRV
jgi:tail tube protein